MSPLLGSEVLVVQRKKAQVVAAARQHLGSEPCAPIQTQLRCLGFFRSARCLEQVSGRWRKHVGFEGGKEGSSHLYPKGKESAGRGTDGRVCGCESVLRCVSGNARRRVGFASLSAGLESGGLRI